MGYVDETEEEESATERSCLCREKCNNVKITFPGAELRRKSSPRIVTELPRGHG